MGARYHYYLLSDSHEGQMKEAEIAGREPSERGTFGDVRQGFVYECVPHITLRDIANNHTTEFERLGRVPVLKARMNTDLHMADDLKKTR